MRNRSLSVSLAAIATLDLSMVKKKIMEPEPEGRGWTKGQASEAEIWYKRFLELCLRHPEVAVVPNYPIDMMWHQHILDTRAYQEDCAAIFGEILHHFPYFGLRGEQDVKNRDDSFDRTNELYLEHFGETCNEMQEFTGGNGEVCGTKTADNFEGNQDKGVVCARFSKDDKLMSSGIGFAEIVSHCGKGGGQKCGKSCGRGR